MSRALGTSKHLDDHWVEAECNLAHGMAGLWGISQLVVH